MSYLLAQVQQPPLILILQQYMVRVRVQRTYQILRCAYSSQI